MTKFTQTQVNILRQHIVENPNQSPRGVAGYFERVSDLDEDTAFSIATVVKHLKNRDESAVALYLTPDVSEPRFSRYANTLVGGAAGDAWGYQVEFTSYDRLPAYPVTAPAEDWVISDDTQMLLATHTALHDAGDLSDIPRVADQLIQDYIAWTHDSDNTRAPGTTCLASLRAIENGHHWNNGGSRRSAGCGSVMRLAPAAFAPIEFRRGLAVLQGVVTHHHPKSVVSSLLLCDAFSQAINNESCDGFLNRANSTLTTLSAALPEDWANDSYLSGILDLLTDDPHAYLTSALGPEPGRSGPTLEQVFSAASTRLSAESTTTGFPGDPCHGIGEGWDAATATALGLFTADIYSSGRLGAVDAVAWAATSNGDSDSIATLGGALIGAMSDHPRFWDDAGLVPQFEPRYERELSEAAETGPAGFGR